MSRIGKKPISIPAGVTITNNGDSVVVKGPKGELAQPFDAEFKLTEEEGSYELNALLSRNVTKRFMACTDHFLITLLSE